MSVKLLTEHHLEFLSLKGGCTGSSESTLVKVQNCWKSHVAAQMLILVLLLAIAMHMHENCLCKWATMIFAAQLNNRLHKNVLQAVNG